MRDMKGKSFGRWIVLEFDHSYRGGTYWFCRCSCGVIRSVFGGNLRNGKSTSCGCLAGELLSARRFKHGGSHSRLWQIRVGMISRCENPRNNRYSSYGARGIRVCSAWRHDFTTFRDWALSHGYADNLTIDRVDNNGNYEPGNCQWLSLSENTRKARLAHKHMRATA